MSGHNIWFPLEQILHVSCLIRKILNQGSQQWYTYDSKMLRTTQNGPRHFLEGFFLTLKVWNVNVFERNIFRWHIFPKKICHATGFMRKDPFVVLKCPEFCGGIYFSQKCRRYLKNGVCNVPEGLIFGYGNLIYNFPK